MQDKKATTNNNNNNNKNNYKYLFCHTQIPIPILTPKKFLHLSSAEDDGWAMSENVFDKECPNMGGVKVDNLQGCKEACLAKKGRPCTGINYAAETTNCYLRACPLPVHEPHSLHYGYKSYWLRENEGEETSYLVKVCKSLFGLLVR